MLQGKEHPSRTGTFGLSEPCPSSCAGEGSSPRALATVVKPSVGAFGLDGMSCDALASLRLDENNDKPNSYAPFSLY